MERCREAAGLLPPRLRDMVLAVDGQIQKETEEIRLRSARCPSLVLSDKEVSLSGVPVTQEDLERVLDLVTGYSRYTAQETIRRGFVMAEGGFRVGLCGSAVMEQGVLRTIKDLSSLSIRIPREQKGIAEAVLKEVCPGGSSHVESCLVVAPPGVGKTTFLRDAVRCLSDDYGQRIALVDERGELAAVCRGTAQLDVGRYTDVMTLCPKNLAIPLLLRAMNPQIIAVDEVVQPSDVQAMEQAAHSGAVLMASVHGTDLPGLRSKPLFDSLLKKRIFTKAILISRSGPHRCYRVEDIL